MDCQHFFFFCGVFRPQFCIMKKWKDLLVMQKKTYVPILSFLGIVHKKKLHFKHYYIVVTTLGGALVRQSKKHYSYIYVYWYFVYIFKCLISLMLCFLCPTSTSRSKIMPIEKYIFPMLQGLKYVDRIFTSL